jgi:uncharacterized OB-fold protein
MTKNCPRCGRAMTLEALERRTTGTVWGWTCLHCNKSLCPQWDEETAIQREKDGPRNRAMQVPMAL